VKKHKKTAESESRAVVLRKEAAQTIETVIAGDKTDTKTKDAPLDAAASLVNDFTTAISKSSGANHFPSACWSCDQTCIFFNGRWYNDTAGFKDKIEGSAIFNKQ
jgi:hypothetical protein